MTVMTPGQYHNIMDRLENVKFEALRFAGVPDIPKEYDENDGIWLRAIAKVITNTAIHSYAIVENNGLGAVKFIKVFDTYGISRIESIHPYMFAETKNVKKSPDAFELKDELAKAYGVSREEIDSVSPEQLKELEENYRVKKALADKQAAAERSEKAKEAKAAKEAAKETEVEKIEE